MHVVFIVTPNCCWGEEMYHNWLHALFKMWGWQQRKKLLEEKKDVTEMNELNSRHERWVHVGSFQTFWKTFYWGVWAAQLFCWEGKKCYSLLSLCFLFSLSLQNAEWWRDPKLSEVQPRVLVQSSAASLLLNRVSPIHLTYTLALPFFKSSRPHLRNQSWCKIKNRVFSV